MSLMMAFTPGSPRIPARSDRAALADMGRPWGEPARRDKDFPQQTVMKCTSLLERVSRSSVRLRRCKRAKPQAAGKGSFWVGRQHFDHPFQPLLRAADAADVMAGVAVPGVEDCRDV